MAITAALVKELRERTGAGMMECKKALVETNGEIESAIEHLRKSGMAKADKKGSRTAAEGLPAIAMSDDAKQAAIVEVNCETDFVSKGDEFKEFANAIASRILKDKPANLKDLLELPFSDDDSQNIADFTKTLIAKIGENMAVRRFELIQAKGDLSTYLHGTRIAVIVDVEGGDAELGKDIAMHIAASRPICVSDKDVSQETIDKEKEIFAAQAQESGKPADIIEKMVEGRIKKFLKEVTLLGQPFVKNPDQSIAQLLKDKGATVVSFTRYEVGEGLEKKSENFAEEVMAQVQGG